MTVTLKGTNLKLTAALKAYASEKVESLEKFFPGITVARIELGKTSRHHQKGDVWRAEATLDGPKHVFRAEAVAEDIYAAIDMVRDELKRDLQRLKEKRAAKIRSVRRAKTR